MKTITSYLIALAIVASLFSCGNTDKNTNDEKENKKSTEKEQVEVKAEEEMSKTFKDSRDRKTYKITKIGDQVWFAENLAYKPSSGNFWIYENKEENVEKYGYLYDYKTAQKVAPEGWHLPTKTEFETLLNHYGEKPYNALTEDKEGLTIVYGGWFYDESGFTREGHEVGFWSVTKEDEDKAWLCIIDGKFKHTFVRSRYMNGTGASVRLIKD